MTSRRDKAIAWAVGEGAAFVRCGGASGKVARRWKSPDKREYIRPKATTLIQHLQGSAPDDLRTIALLPDTLGLTVIDMDGGGEGNQAKWAGAFDEPLHVGRSRSGGRHVWYRHPEGKQESGCRSGIHAFALPRLDGRSPNTSKDAPREERATDGEVFSGDHYVVLWDEAYLIALLEAVASKRGCVITEDMLRLLGVRKPVRPKPPAKVLEGIVTSKKGTHNDTIYRAARDLLPANSEAGCLWDRAILLCAEAVGHARDRAVNTLASARKSRAAEWRRMSAGMQAITGGAKEGDDRPVEPALIEGGRSIHGFAEACGRLGWRLCHDTMHHDIAIDTGAGWTLLDDAISKECLGQLEARFYYETSKGTPPFRVSHDLFDTWATTLGRRMWRSDAAEWVRACRDRVAKDGGLTPAREARTAAWLDDLFVFSRSTSTEAVQFVARFLLACMVARALEPGTDAQIMPVLRSVDQELGKSYLGRALMPPEPKWTRYFTDEFSFAWGAKEMREAVEGKWVVEAGELASTRKAEVQAQRQFISRSVDRGRPAYGRKVKDMPRTCLLYGTANDQDVLPDDPHGQRRYVVLDIVANAREGEVKDLVDGVLDRERETLFGTMALMIEERGAHAFLHPTASLKARLRESAEHHRHVDEAENAVAVFADRFAAKERELHGYFRMQEAVEASGLARPDRATGDYEQVATGNPYLPRRVAKVLTRLRFERRKRRIGNASVWVWVRANDQHMGGYEEQTVHARRELLGIPDPLAVLQETAELTRPDPDREGARKPVGRENIEAHEGGDREPGDDRAAEAAQEDIPF